MNAEQFAKGFERSPREYASLRGREWQRARDALIDPSLRWAHLFSHIVDSYLREGVMDFDETRKNIGIYTGNSTHHLLANIIRETEKAAVYQPTLIPHLNRMNFHTINQEMEPVWQYLLDPEGRRPLDYIDLTAMQAKLAVQALRLVETRRQISENFLTVTPEEPLQYNLVDRSFVGRTTEVDATIALLEVIKQLPFGVSENVLVVPAPPKYGSYKDRSSDLLILDIADDQAHGIQVKTRVYDPSHYDKTYVSFIDGVEDLGNYKLKVHSNGAKSRYPIPGLIAADFLLNNEALHAHSGFARLPEFQGTYGAILHARKVAEPMRDHMEYTDRAARAAEKIAPRIIAALNRNASPNKEKPDGLPGLDEIE